MIGQTILHYKILEKLGEGGMGVVYKAQDTKLNRPVALKFLPTKGSTDNSTRDRFLHEAKAAAALNHPNICTIYGVDEFEGTMFISMEYVEGGTLGPHIPYGKVPEALDIAIQISEALQEAHRKGVIHRDVKPGNVLVDANRRVKVMDFGLAQLSGALRGATSPTTMGTPAYMAPEQIQGAEADPRSDIFSFGVLLYEMLAGRLPFRGDHTASMMYSIVHEDPPPLSSVRDDVPESLERIIRQSLEKDMSRRFQDVPELLRLLRGVTMTAPPGAPGELLAVLPFDNISPDKENEYFSEGLTEEIIAALSKLRNLRVISRTSAMRYKGTDRSVKEIAGELHAKYVLEGSVRMSDQDLRITALLIDADQDVHLWAETYRGNLKDIFDIQEKVAGKIVRALKLRLTADEKRTLKKRFTDNTEAYQLYLQGRYFWNRRTEGGLNAAIRYFEQAIEKDPHYSLAWAGIADAYNLLGAYGDHHRKDLYRKAKTAVTRALEIDDHLAEAHTSLAMLLMLDEWDWMAAEKEFKLAISLDPQYPTAHHWYSEWLMYTGRHDAALAEISRAAELDPVSPAILKDKGLAHYYGRRYEQAIEVAKKALELDPSFSTVHRLLSLSYQGLRQFDQAMAEHDRWRILTGNEVEASFALAQLYAVSGRGDEARGICERLLSDSPLGGIAFRALALVCAALDDKDMAFEWLEKGYERRDDSLCSLKVDPKMDNLREDPRFVSLLRRIGLER